MALILEVQGNPLAELEDSSCIALPRQLGRGRVLHRWSIYHALDPQTEVDTAYSDLHLPSSRIDFRLLLVREYLERCGTTLQPSYTIYRHQQALMHTNR